MFEQAGLTKGMRVLDVGSGNGDVAFLAAAFVGESGEVLGIDRAPSACQRLVHALKHMRLPM
jgi:ubiquinone/menaquinone biosynthesis C-methylase UbiE